jgi:hypothetical protein
MCTGMCYTMKWKAVIRRKKGLEQKVDPLLEERKS